MRRIIEVIGVETKLKDDKPYQVTHVVLDDGEEATGYGEYRVGDLVERFYDPRYDRIKIKRTGRFTPL